MSNQGKHNEIKQGQGQGQGQKTGQGIYTRSSKLKRAASYAENFSTVSKFEPSSRPNSPALASRLTTPPNKTTTADSTPSKKTNKFSFKPIYSPSLSPGISKSTEQTYSSVINASNNLNTSNAQSNKQKSNHKTFQPLVRANSVNESGIFSLKLQQKPTNSPAQKLEPSKSSHNLYQTPITTTTTNNDGGLNSTEPNHSEYPTSTKKSNYGSPNSDTRKTSSSDLRKTPRFEPISHEASLTPSPSIYVNRFSSLSSKPDNKKNSILDFSFTPPNPLKDSRLPHSYETHKRNLSNRIISSFGSNGLINLTNPPNQDHQNFSRSESRLQRISSLPSPSSPIKSQLLSKIAPPTDLKFLPSSLHKPLSLQKSQPTLHTGISPLRSRQKLFKPNLELRARTITPTPTATTTATTANPNNKSKAINSKSRSYSGFNHHLSSFSSSKRDLISKSKTSLGLGLDLGTKLDSFPQMLPEVGRISPYIFPDKKRIKMEPSRSIECFEIRISLVIAPTKATSTINLDQLVKAEQNQLSDITNSIKHTKSSREISLYPQNLHLNNRCDTSSPLFSQLDQAPASLIDSQLPSTEKNIIYNDSSCAPTSHEPGNLLISSENDQLAVESLFNLNKSLETQQELFFDSNTIQDSTLSNTSDVSSISDKHANYDVVYPEQIFSAIEYYVTVFEASKEPIKLIDLKNPQNSNWEIQHILLSKAKLNVVSVSEWEPILMCTPVLIQTTDSPSAYQPSQSSSSCLKKHDFSQFHHYETHTLSSFIRSQNLSGLKCKHLPLSSLLKSDTVKLNSIEDLVNSVKTERKNSIANRTSQLSSSPLIISKPGYNKDLKPLFPDHLIKNQAQTESPTQNQHELEIKNVIESETKTETETETEIKTEMELQNTQKDKINIENGSDRNKSIYALEGRDSGSPRDKNGDENAGASHALDQEQNQNQNQNLGLNRESDAGVLNIDGPNLASSYDAPLARIKQNNAFYLQDDSLFFFSAQNGRYKINVLLVKPVAASRDQKVNWRVENSKNLVYISSPSTGSKQRRSQDNLFNSPVFENGQNQPSFAPHQTVSNHTGSFKSIVLEGQTSLITVSGSGIASESGSEPSFKPTSNPSFNTHHNSGSMPASKANPGFDTSFEICKKASLENLPESSNLFEPKQKLSEPTTVLVSDTSPTTLSSLSFSNTPPGTSGTDFATSANNLLVFNNLPDSKILRVQAVFPYNKKRPTKLKANSDLKDTSKGLQFNSPLFSFNNTLDSMPPSKLTESNISTSNETAKETKKVKKPVDPFVTKFVVDTPIRYKKDKILLNNINFDFNDLSPTEIDQILSNCDFFVRNTSNQQLENQTANILPIKVTTHTFDSQRFLDPGRKNASMDLQFFDTRNLASSPVSKFASFDSQSTLKDGEYEGFEANLESKTKLYNDKFNFSRNKECNDLAFSFSFLTKSTTPKYEKNPLQKNTFKNCNDPLFSSDSIKNQLLQPNTSTNLNTDTDTDTDMKSVTKAETKLALSQQTTKNSSFLDFSNETIFKQEPLFFDVDDFLFYSAINHYQLSNSTSATNTHQIPSFDQTSQQPPKPISHKIVYEFSYKPQTKSIALQYYFRLRPTQTSLEQSPVISVKPELPSPVDIIGPGLKPSFSSDLGPNPSLPDSQTPILDITPEAIESLNKGLLNDSLDQFKLGSGENFSEICTEASTSNLQQTQDSEKNEPIPRVFVYLLLVTLLTTLGGYLFITSAPRTLQPDHYRKLGLDFYVYFHNKICSNIGSLDSTEFGIKLCELTKLRSASDLSFNSPSFGCVYDLKNEISACKPFLDTFVLHSSPKCHKLQLSIHYDKESSAQDACILNDLQNTKTDHTPTPVSTLSILAIPDLEDSGYSSLEECLDSENRAGDLELNGGDEQAASDVQGNADFQNQQKPLGQGIDLSHDQVLNDLQTSYKQKLENHNPDSINKARRKSNLDSKRAKYSSKNYSFLKNIKTIKIKLESKSKLKPKRGLDNSKGDPTSPDFVECGDNCELTKNSIQAYDSDRGNGSVLGGFVSSYKAILKLLYLLFSG